jgi:hypothetical protein
MADLEATLAAAQARMERFTELTTNFRVVASELEAQSEVEKKAAQLPAMAAKPTQ